MVTRCIIFWKSSYRQYRQFTNKIRLVAIFYWREFYPQQVAISGLKKKHTVCLNFVQSNNIFEILKYHWNTFWVVGESWGVTNFQVKYNYPQFSRFFSLTIFDWYRFLSEEKRKRSMEWDLGSLFTPFLILHFLRCFRLCQNKIKKPSRTPLK